MEKAPNESIRKNTKKRICKLFKIYFIRRNKVIIISIIIGFIIGIIFGRTVYENLNNRWAVYRWNKNCKQSMKLKDWLPCSCNYEQILKIKRIKNKLKIEKYIETGKIK
jgi:hypothetical protein